MSNRSLKAALYVMLLGAVLGVTLQPAAGQDLERVSRPNGHKGNQRTYYSEWAKGNLRRERHQGGR